jgi:hypothetical protein
VLAEEPLPRVQVQLCVPFTIGGLLFELVPDAHPPTLEGVIGLGHEALPEEPLPEGPPHVASVQLPVPATCEHVQLAAEAGRRPLQLPLVQVPAEHCPATLGLLPHAPLTQAGFDGALALQLV